MFRAAILERGVRVNQAYLIEDCIPCAMRGGVNPTCGLCGGSGVIVTQRPTLTGEEIALESERAGSRAEILRQMRRQWNDKPRAEIKLSWPLAIWIAVTTGCLIYFLYQIFGR